VADLDPKSVMNGADAHPGPDLDLVTVTIVTPIALGDVQGQGVDHATVGAAITTVAAPVAGHGPGHVPMIATVDGVILVLAATVAIVDTVVVIVAEAGVVRMTGALAVMTESGLNHLSLPLPPCLLSLRSTRKRRRRRRRRRSERIQRQRTMLAEMRRTVWRTGTRCEPSLA
jgi:hypothetical protein